MRDVVPATPGSSRVMRNNAAVTHVIHMYLNPSQALRVLDQSKRQKAIEDFFYSVDIYMLIYYSEF